MAVKDRIRKLIRASGMKQKALAERLGTTESWISDRATGRVPALADELPRLAEVLGCHPCDFFDDPPPAKTALPPAFPEAFEHEGAQNILYDLSKLDQLKALTPRDTAIVADLVASLKRHRAE